MDLNWICLCTFTGFRMFFFYPQKKRAKKKTRNVQFNNPIVLNIPISIFLVMPFIKLDPVGLLLWFNHWKFQWTKAQNFIYYMIFYYKIEFQNKKKRIAWHRF